MEDISSAQIYFENNPDIEVSMAVFAPHANSYCRLRPSEHAPTYASWGFDNRSAAVRVITASKPATALYIACKQQELAEFSIRVTDMEYDAYIRTM